MSAPEPTTSTRPATSTGPRRRRWALRLVALSAAALLAAPLAAGTARAETPSPSPSPDAGGTITTTTPTPTPTLASTPTPTPTLTAEATKTPTPALAPAVAPTAETLVATTVALSEGEQAIADKYAAIGDLLGAPTTGVFCGGLDGGCYQVFEDGAIVWSPATGAQVSKGAIRAKWAATGYEWGFLGYPTTDEVCGLVRGGCYQMFEGGGILWSPTAGAHVSKGAIRTKWGQTGYESGFLGYPTTDEICGLVNGGCYQMYEGGAILWSSASGAHWNKGAIRSNWAATGYERGVLGYPTSDEVCGQLRGGCYQVFQGGAISWSPTTGAHYTTGALRTMWAQRGYEWGSYGYPMSDPFSVSGKTSQRFEGGYLTTGVDTRCLTGRTMCASKNDRKLRWMINGQVIQTMDARFGCSTSPTDNGEFKVYWKSYNHTSTIYNTWMPRAMFYNGGEAVHYSTDFASRGYAGCSHGCVNIRDWDGINWLYNQVVVGDKVVVYY